MKFTRYSKFKGFDVSSINLGDLMESISDSLLYSGYSDDYYWTRQREQMDTSLDALRSALLQALVEHGLVDEHQIQEMLAENEGKFTGSLLEELLNQLIERLVDKGDAAVRERRGHGHRSHPAMSRRDLLGQSAGRQQVRDAVVSGARHDER